MGIKLTVDLAECSPSDLAKAAKFMLEYAGFKDPSTQVSRYSANIPDAATLVPPMGSLGEEVHHVETAPIGSQMPGNVPPIPDSYHSDGAERRAAILDTMNDHINPPVDEAGQQVRPLPPPPPGIEVDSQGVPWDSRIHAGSRAKIADGTWRQRRNLDPAVLTTVMAELRATMGVERRAPTPPTPPVPAAVFAPVPPVPPVPAEVPPVPFAGSAVPPAPPSSSTSSAPASAGAATAASPGSAPTFPQLMQRITAAFTQKTLSKAQIDEAMAKVGLKSLPTLASRPDLVGDVATALGIAL